MTNLLKDRVMWFGGYVLSPILTMVGALLLTGCSITENSRRPPIEVWDDMDRQEKFKAQSAVGKDLHSVFADHRSNRRPPEGTIARGHLALDDVLHTGMVSANTFAGRNPVELTPEVLKTGQDRFNVYCTPCHDRTGGGQGIVNLRDPAFKPARRLRRKVTSRRR